MTIDELLDALEEARDDLSAMDEEELKAIGKRLADLYADPHVWTVLAAFHAALSERRKPVGRAPRPGTADY